jgi:hypothetical protein
MRCKQEATVDELRSFLFAAITRPHAPEGLAQ